MGVQLNPGQNVFQNNTFNNLFSPITSTNSVLGKGSLLSFNYAFWKHDPYPLVILTDYTPGKGIRGINLNYLTYNYVKNLLTSYGENKGFSYNNIKFDRYIVGAFRSYKWVGLRMMKRLESKYLINLVSATRSFDKNNLDVIKKFVQEQMNRQVNPKAEPTSLESNQPIQGENLGGI